MVRIYLSMTALDYYSLLDLLISLIIVGIIKEVKFSDGSIKLLDGSVERRFSKFYIMWSKSILSECDRAETIGGGSFNKFTVEFRDVPFGYAGLWGAQLLYYRFFFFFLLTESETSRTLAE